MADDPAQQKKPEACSFVIFGVTGDLAHRLVIPALYNLASKGLLPDDFCVVGVARKAMSNEELCTSLLRGLHEFATRPVDDAVARRLLACVTCIAAEVASGNSAHTRGRPSFLSARSVRSGPQSPRSK